MNDSLTNTNQPSVDTLNIPRNEGRIKRIIFVAPIQAVDQSTPKFLGATRKIFFLLNLLYGQGFEIVLLNSGAEMKRRQEPRTGLLRISSVATVTYFCPATSSFTKLGRCLNILQAKKTLDWVLNSTDRPDFIWCYNAYAFEMIVARYAERKYGIKSVLEFEDWHFARSGWLNPKGLVDYFMWRRCASKIGFCFAVNNFLAEKMRKHTVPTALLPGVLDDNLIELKETHPPFSKKKLHQITCGYFGGLSIEKGAGFLLALIKTSLRDGLPIKWVITGNGPLANQFGQIAAQFPEFVSYFGTVTTFELARLMGSASVVLNPHTWMPGVFPFKILESVGSARLVISSPLDFPSELFWLKKSIVMIPLDVQDWLDTIILAPQIYAKNFLFIEQAHLTAKILYSKTGVSALIKNALHHV